TPPNHHNNHDRVEFRGFVPREHVDGYYAGADVFAFPSDTETQGLVVAEAMSYGLPVVVAQGGGASQAVKPYHSGLVVPSNVESFATGLKTLLADPVLRREWGQHARHLSMELTVPRMTESILSVYRQSIHDVQAS
ncbi:MAG: glycosyltransferase family 4 protein, partial [Fimbriimonadaceae bacterium]